MFATLTKTEMIILVTYILPPSPTCLEVCLLHNFSFGRVNPFNKNQTIPDLHDLEKEIFRKKCWKKEKMLETSIFSFTTMFSTLLEENTTI